jgi:hypothetical protein
MFKFIEGLPADVLGVEAIDLILTDINMDGVATTG